MNRQLRTLGAFGGILVALACSAHAQAAPQFLRVIAVSDGRSDSNLRWANRQVEQNIDMLQRDRHDYDGHRARAIELFGQARQQLELGLAYDNGGEYRGATGQPDVDATNLRGDGTSDANLVAVRRNIEGIMDALARDNHDYGGHRVAALQLLTAGREQLSAALAADDRR